MVSSFEKRACGVAGLSLVVAIASGACSARSSSVPGGSGNSGPSSSAGTGATVGAGGSGGASNGVAGSVSVGGATSGASGATSIAGTGSSTGGATGVGGALSGAAGSSTGSAGSSAGAAGSSGAPAKLCATKVTAASTQIANFENYDGMTAVDKYAFAFAGATNGTAGVYGGPYGYAGGTDVVTLSILAGHSGNYGLTESTTPAANWGEGLGFWMGCVNASAYKGIQFWVRGVVPSGVFSFSVNTENTTLPDSKNAAAGGTCTGTADTCKAPTKSNIPISMDWTQVMVPWADLTGGLSAGTPVVANGDNITGLNLTMALMYTGSEDAGYTAVPGDISFAIDDIEFMP